MSAGPRLANSVAVVLLGLVTAAVHGTTQAAEPQSGPPQSGPPQSERPQSGELQPSVTLPPDLQRVLADYEAAWSARDAQALARLFAEDGFVLSSGRPPVRGRAAIEKAYAGSGGPLALRAFAFATHGDLGYILGGFAHRRGDPDTGKFTLTLRKDAGGRWLIVSDMDNGNRRPGPPPGGGP